MTIENTKKKKGKKTEVSANVHFPKSSNASLGSRGRTFEGTVTKKFPKRVVVEFERTVFVPKYKSFYRKKTKLHARLLDQMEKEINIGDFIKVRECRPLSKIIHFLVIEKIRTSSQTKSGAKQ